MNGKARLIEQVVIVTGASSGIGRATSLAFAREGAIPILVSRSKEKLEKVAGEIRRIHSHVRVVPADVSSQAQVHDMVERVAAEFRRVDILVNNAGIAHVGSIGQESFMEDLKEMMEVDFYGTVYCTKAVLPILQRQGSGHIINMSSVVGRKAFPHFAGYSASMHAIAGFSDALRQELYGSGIHVSTIHPALTQTALLNHVDPADMPSPFKRMTPITAEQVAEGILQAVLKRQPRVILPFPPKLLLLQDALSPRLGDRIVRMFSSPGFTRLIGMYRGRVYKRFELDH
jgi:short-subunit dehydrogenase